MAVSFNAREVLEMARQIERNGVRFYERAAGCVDQPKTAEALLGLAEMERSHERVFAEMVGMLTSQDGPEPFFDPYGESEQYLRALAGSRVFDMSADPVEWLGVERDAADILRKAIGLEKDSIVFYLGIKELVPPMMGRDRLEEIIAEEMSHIVTLTDQINASAG